MGFLAISGRGQSTEGLCRAFEEVIYSTDRDGRSLLERHFSAARETGISNHLGIPRNPKQRPGGHRSGRPQAQRSSVEDILSWASELGLLTSPGVRHSYGLTKDGHVYRQLVGDKLFDEFRQGTANPFLLPAMERRFLFLQEISRDCVLVLLLRKLAEAFPVETHFCRSGSEGKTLVRYLISAFEAVKADLRAARLSAAEKELVDHIAMLQLSIGEVPDSANARRAAALRNARNRAPSNASDSFKMAKHRLTPRLEHLADYGYLNGFEGEPGASGESVEFCWTVTRLGHDAAALFRQLPPAAIHQLDRVEDGSFTVPGIREFLLRHAMRFFASTESIPTCEASQADIIKHLVWAYNVCGMRYGYSEFLGIGKLASLHALESGKLMEIGQVYAFLHEVVPSHPELSNLIRFASRPEPENMHIRILDVAKLCELNI